MPCALCVVAGVTLAERGPQSWRPAAPPAVGELVDLGAEVTLLRGNCRVGQLLVRRLELVHGDLHPIFVRADLRADEAVGGQQIRHALPRMGAVERGGPGASAQPAHLEPSACVRAREQIDGVQNANAAIREEMLVVRT